MKSIPLERSMLSRILHIALGQIAKFWLFLAVMFLVAGCVSVKHCSNVYEGVYSAAPLNKALYISEESGKCTYVSGRSSPEQARKDAYDACTNFNGDGCRLWSTNDVLSSLARNRNNSFENGIDKTEAVTSQDIFALVTNENQNKRQSVSPQQIGPGAPLANQCIALQYDYKWNKDGTQQFLNRCNVEVSFSWCNSGAGNTYSCKPSQDGEGSWSLKPGTTVSTGAGTNKNSVPILAACDVNTKTQPILKGGVAACR